MTTLNLPSIGINAEKMENNITLVLGKLKWEYVVERKSIKIYIVPLLVLIFAFSLFFYVFFRFTLLAIIIAVVPFLFTIYFIQENYFSIRIFKVVTPTKLDIRVVGGSLVPPNLSINGVTEADRKFVRQFLLEFIENVPTKPWNRSLFGNSSAVRTEWEQWLQ